jgi:hypothetical protein
MSGSAILDIVGLDFVYLFISLMAKALKEVEQPLGPGEPPVAVGRGRTG